MAKKQTLGEQFLEELEKYEKIESQMAKRKSIAKKRIDELNEELKMINAEILGTLDTKEESKLKNKKKKIKEEIEEFSEYTNLSSHDLHMIMIKKINSGNLKELQRQAKEEYLEAKKPYDDKVEEAEKALEKAKDNLKQFKNKADYTFASNRYSTLVSGSRAFRKFNL